MEKYRVGQMLIFGGYHGFDKYHKCRIELGIEKNQNTKI